MISKEEFIKKFKDKYNKCVGIWDTKENRENYFKKLDLDEEYEAFKKDVNSDTTYDYTEACISRIINYYYMLYPDDY